MRETGISLKRIVEQVKAINELVSNIAQAAQEQAESIGQLNVAMADMEQTTQKKCRCCGTERRCKPQFGRYV